MHICDNHYIEENLLRSRYVTASILWLSKGILAKHLKETHILDKKQLGINMPYVNFTSKNYWVSYHSKPKSG